MLNTVNNTANHRANFSMWLGEYDNSYIVKYEEHLRVKQLFNKGNIIEGTLLIFNVSL